MQDIPNLSGKTIVVTGANSGLGLETTKLLATAGAHVILACRTESKARAAMDAVREVAPQASIEFLALDLADLASVQAFTAAFEDTHEQLDVLCNNAGVMALPRCETADGFEMQLGTNHLGHFALTSQLLPTLLRTPGARVVNVSSLMHAFGKMNFDDLHGRRSYEKWTAYSQSKLANLLFSYELQRKIEQADAPLLSVASHPGYASTNLQTAGPKQAGSKFGERLWGTINLVAQSAEMGAMPTVRASADPDVRGGTFYGPRGPGQMRGYPKQVQPTRQARREDLAAKLWELSVSETGADFKALTA